MQHLKTPISEKKLRRITQILDSDQDGALKVDIVEKVCLRLCCHCLYCRSLALLSLPLLSLALLSLALLSLLSEWLMCSLHAQFPYNGSSALAHV